MGRSYSCSRRETLVYLKLHRESLAFDILRNTKAQQLQCAYRSCAARKFSLQCMNCLYAEELLTE
jgi:hypothetical protein